MWLVNDDGFFSTVQDYKDSEWVYVRARSETDVESFVAGARLRYAKVASPLIRLARKTSGL